MSSDDSSTTSSDSSSSDNDVRNERQESASKIRKSNNNTSAKADAAVRKAAAPGTNGAKSKTNTPVAVVGNELSHLIPGYTAPMRLEAKSLKGIANKSISELRKGASRHDATAYCPAVSILNKQQPETFDPSVMARKVKTPSSISIQKISGVKKIPTSFSSSFRKTAAKKQQNDNTAGSGWFGMQSTPLTSQLQTDLAMIRNRNYLDPKKFYKSSDTFGKVLQVGTVIEGNSEFYSSRLVKKDRRQNLTEEIMADANVSSYAKRKFHDLQMERVRQGQPKRWNVGKRERGKRH